MTQTVGELNGRWSVLFRFVLGAVPLILAAYVPWVVWVTNEVFTQRLVQGQYARKEDMYTMRREFWDELRRLPSPDWRNKISTIESKVDEISATQMEILLKLERLGGTAEE